LEIQRIRFEDRLVVELAVEPETRRARVPSLVLQPLVENALRHGIDRTAGGGRLGLAASRLDGRLRLTIANDGPMPIAGDEASARLHVGLANTRDRLAQLYGEDYLLRLEPLAAGGAVVTLELPWRDAHEDADADRRRRTAGAPEAAHTAAAS
ncbi:MAG TPA: hypothetical protein VN811_00160, partial [Thermoanaerobaculia bacterium]|nr:hypothetical protein [Thermoanaerobaculia bacterium]